VTRPSNGGEQGPDLSLVMPCYNEEKVLRYTASRLLEAFRGAGLRLELVAVDNGSQDRTGELIRELARERDGVVLHTVEVNEGYGNGVLQGLPRCTAPWVGIIPADGQVDSEDVVRLFEAALAADAPVVAKVRRRFRMDGLLRKAISIGYNLFVRLLWPRMASLDVNGSPKIMPRHVLPLMQLESKEWFLDPEILIKAHYLGLRIIEFNVFARMRGAGLSHVRPTTAWEFFRKLLAYRFSSRLRAWRKQGGRSAIQRSMAEPPTAGVASR
jgi:glycosyltransferase involved in cell wall biosynthesis